MWCIDFHRHECYLYLIDGYHVCLVSKLNLKSSEEGLNFHPAEVSVADVYGTKKKTLVFAKVLQGQKYVIELIQMTDDN